MGDNNKHEMWKENSLDLLDWEPVIKSSSKVLNYMVEYISTIDEKKVFKLLSFRDYEADAPLPLESKDLDEVCDILISDIILKHSPMNLSPNFYGWAMGCGNPVNIISSIVEAALNANVIGGNQISCIIEKQVINWLRTIINYPTEASGILTSGCTEANLIALNVARNHKDFSAIHNQGLKDKKYVFYASSQVHCSITQSLQILGLGKESLRLIEVCEDFCINTNLLRRQIIADIENGYEPIAIIVNIGTVNTGAIDNIALVSEIAREYNLWLHADAAFGIFGLMLEKFKKYSEMVHMLDSIAFDLHKWMQIPYASGCVFIKDKKLHCRTFTTQEGYIEHSEDWLSDYGISLSRDFKALHIWMFLKAYGIEKLKQCIEKSIDNTWYLYKKLSTLPNFEILCPPTLNILCFRYIGGTADRDANNINKGIVSMLQAQGECFPSGTMINNRFYIRICCMNYRTEKKHIDKLIDLCINATKAIQI